MHILCAGGEYLAISAGGLSSACQFQSNPPKLMRCKLPIKLMYTMFSLELMAFRT